MGENEWRRTLTAATTNPWRSGNIGENPVAHAQQQQLPPGSLRVGKQGWRRTHTAAAIHPWRSGSIGENPAAHAQQQQVPPGCLRVGEKGWSRTLTAATTTPRRSGSIGENPAAHAQQQELVLGASWSVWKLRRRSYSCPAATATPWGTAAGRQPPHSSNK